MKKTIKHTNKYIILATPLILYSLFSSVYMLVSAAGNGIGLIFAVVLLALMTAAFIAGWFNMIKVSILQPNMEEPNSLIKEFPAGVGEYFLSSLGVLLNIFIISIVIYSATYFIGMNFIGDIGVSTENLSKAIASKEALKAFMLGLSMEQLVKINLWNITILLATGLLYFLVILYLPALFFKSKNPFIALIKGFQDLFSKKFFNTLGIFVLIFMTNFIVSILSTIFGAIPFLHFILTLLNFYLITLICVGIFMYYHSNFIESYIGQNVDVKI